MLRATIAVTRSGNSISDIKIPEEAREGIFNGTAWAWTMLSGPRIKRGPDRDEAVRGSRMLEEADWHSLYPKSRVAGLEAIDGRACYKVLLLPSAAQKTEWFDTETGLPARRSFPGSHRAARFDPSATWNRGAFTMASNNPSRHKMLMFVEESMDLFARSGNPIGS